MEDERGAAVRAQLRDAGVPAWAPYSPDDRGRVRCYGWVDDFETLRSAVVGPRKAPHALGQLIEQCAQLLSEGPRNPTVDGAVRSTPSGLATPTALVVVHVNGVGHGPLGRSQLRPLADLVRFVTEVLKQHMGDRT